MQLMRGRSFRQAFFIFLSWTLCVLVVTYFGGMFFLRQVTDEVITRQQALVGYLVETTNIDNETLTALMLAQSPIYQESGERILAHAGYREGLTHSLEPVMNNVLPKLPLWLAVYLFLLIIPMLIYFFLSQKHVKKMTERIAYAAERAVEGDYDVPVSDTEDGDFDRLCHLFNQMRTRLADSITALETDRKLLKQTMTDISHQLKTPLSTAMMVNELVLSGKDMPTETRTAFLEKGDVALQRMEWLIYSLLKISSLESGYIPLKTDQIDLMEVAREAIGNLKPMASQCSVSLILCEEATDVVIQGDLEWLTEAVGNLIKNAIEHVGEDRKVFIKVSATPLLCRLQVVDHGKGIPESERERIFERFYRTNDRSSTGIGIGLALARLIIRRMNGDVWAESGHETQGATFTVVFHLL